MRIILLKDNNVSKKVIQMKTYLLFKSTYRYLYEFCKNV